jgi:hypothetical protein
MAETCISRRGSWRVFEPYYDAEGVVLYHGDCREVMATLSQESVSCVVTSPPFLGLAILQV